MFMPDRYKLLL